MKEFIYKLIPGFLKIGYYKLRGKRPWSWGYTTFKFDYIKKAIYDREILGKFKNSDFLPKGFGFSLDERAVEYPWVISKILVGSCNFMDAGSALNRKDILEHPVFKNKKITILNLNPEQNCFWQKGISYVFGDIRQMPFKDSYFDFITCLSTLEHVGMDNTFLYVKDQRYKEEKLFDFEKAVLELKRVLKKGGSIFITVPFGKYQNFNYFQQFDSSRIGRILEVFKPQSHQINYYKYEKDGWNISDEESCKDVEYSKIQKSDFIVAAKAVACIEFIK